MRPALPIVLLLASAVAAQLPADGRTSYSRDDRIRIPFELRSGDRATKVVLYYAFDGGAWQEADSVRPGGKKEFLFRADRDGPYAFATMTHFSDGKTDPERRDLLTEQRRVVIDKTPPRVTVRQSQSAEGAPGIEWEVSDEYMDPRGVRLEFRWPEMTRFDAIDKNVPFGPRDSRHWQLRGNDRMQVRVVATDRAGNRTDSEALWVSTKEGASGVAEAVASQGPASGASTVRDSEVSQTSGSRSAHPSLHYVNTRTVSLNVNATVGPSGLTRAYLYAADDKLVWAKAKEEGAKSAPPVTDPDKPRLVPLNFVYEADKDGLYSFIIIVENHRGPSRRVPQKGDAGDVQVMVDTTKPVVEVVSTRVASNGDRGAVVDIRWKATDANIAPVPIKLEYQAVREDRPGEAGEWKAIAPDWIDNTGQHTWSPPTGEAYLFHIRVTCKDRAGNEHSAQSVKPVNTDLYAPGVKDFDVTPGRGGAGFVPGGGGNVAVPATSGITVSPVPAGMPVVLPK